MRRSEGALPATDTAIYIADTIGDLGLFYRLATFAFVGGSLIPHGGQNPLEPARLGCAVLAGPHTENFADAYRAIFEAQGAGRVQSSREIAALAERLLSAPDDAAAMAKRQPPVPQPWAARSRRRDPPSKRCWHAMRTPEFWNRTGHDRAPRGRAF